MRERTRFLKKQDEKTGAAFKMKRRLFLSGQIALRMVEKIRVGIDCALKMRPKSLSCRVKVKLRIVCIGGWTFARRGHRPPSTQGSPQNLRGFLRLHFSQILRGYSRRPALYSAGGVWPDQRAVRAERQQVIQFCPNGVEIAVPDHCGIPLELPLPFFRL